MRSVLRIAQGSLHKRGRGWPGFVATQISMGIDFFKRNSGHADNGMPAEKMVF
jgi:hypothetical protein